MVVGSLSHSIVSCRMVIAMRPFFNTLHRFRDSDCGVEPGIRSFNRIPPRNT